MLLRATLSVECGSYVILLRGSVRPAGRVSPNRALSGGEYVLGIDEVASRRGAASPLP